MTLLDWSRLGNIDGSGIAEVVVARVNAFIEEPGWVWTHRNVGKPFTALCKRAVNKLF